jgi:hypothetical protein
LVVQFVEYHSNAEDIAEFVIKRLTFLELEYFGSNVTRCTAFVEE